eukprot:g5009.t1
MIESSGSAYPLFVPTTHPLDPESGTATNMGGMPWAPLVASKAQKLVLLSDASFTTDDAASAKSEALCFSRQQPSETSGVVHPGVAILPTTDTCAATLTQVICAAERSKAVASSGESVGDSAESACISGVREGTIPLAYYVPRWSGLPPLFSSRRSQLPLMYSRNKEPFNTVLCIGNDASSSGGSPNAVTSVQSIESTAVELDLAFDVTCSSFSKYPDYDGDTLITGWVDVRQISFTKGKIAEAVVEIHYEFSGLEPNASGGWHVHSGSSCETNEDVGGHFWTEGVTDPWTDIKWTSSKEGKSSGSVRLLGLTVSSLANRTVVVHNAAKVRVACGILLPVGKNVQNAETCINAKVKNTIVDIPEFLVPNCRNALQRLACSLYMPFETKVLCLSADGNCTDNDGDKGFSYALPRFPSLDLCEDANNACMGASGFPLDCAEKVEKTFCNSAWSAAISPAEQNWGCASSFQGIPKYPAKRQNFVDLRLLMPSLSSKVALMAGSSAATLTKADVIADLSDLPSEIGGSSIAQSQCPVPLSVPSNQRSKVKPVYDCAMDCYTPFFAEKFYSRLGACVKILGFVGLALVGLLLLTVLLKTSKRGDYGTISVLGASFSLVLAICLSSIRGMRETFCEDDNTAVAQDSGASLCIVQAILICYSGSLAVYVYLRTARKLYKRVHSNRQISSKTKNSWSLCACFILPFVQCLCLLYTNSFGYRAPVMYCLFSQSERDWLPSWIFFYGPMIFAWFCGTVYLYFAMMKMYSVIRVSGMQFSHLRAPIIYLICFSLILWPMLFGRLYIQIKQDRFRTVGQEWVQCLLENYANGILNPATDCSADTSMMSAHKNGCGCGLTIPGTVSGALIILIHCSILGQAFIILGAWGPSKSNADFWNRCVKMNYNCLCICCRRFQKRSEPDCEIEMHAPPMQGERIGDVNKNVGGHVTS